MRPRFDTLLLATVDLSYLLLLQSGRSGLYLVVLRRLSASLLERNRLQHSEITRAEAISALASLGRSHGFLVDPLATTAKAPLSSVVFYRWV